jgi:Fibronectin type III domain
MVHRSRLRTRWPVVAICAALALTTSRSVASSGNGSAPLEFDEAKIRIELNATAQDAGIQMLLDAEDWKRVEIYLPHGGARIMHVRASSSVGRIGVTELFFESAEPTLADLPLKDLLRMFPEGRYRLVGRTTDGREMVGTARLTHDIPAGPTVVVPTEGAVTSVDDTVIDWDPVVEPAGIEIAGYQVIVELEEPLRVFSVDLPASVTAVTVPPAFLKPGTDYKFEVLAIARGGGRNQTITESTFTTAP